MPEEISRRDDRHDPPLLCVSQGEISRIVTLNSGTSGPSKRIFFTPEDQESTIDFFEQGMSVFTRPGDRVLILFPGERPGSVGSLLAVALQRMSAIPMSGWPVDGERKEDQAGTGVSRCWSPGDDARAGTPLGTHRDGAITRARRAPQLGLRIEILDRAATVVVGYCTSCGGFLGDAYAAPATPESLWTARQVGQMLSMPPRVAADGVTKLLEVVIERMADGNVAAFAQKVGLSKSGVWHWVRKGGLPTLPAWLAISLHGGIGLEKLHAGELSDWQPPGEAVQLSMLPTSPRKGIRSRELDWDAIRAQLRELLTLELPITLAEACERVGVDHKRLYLRANAEARAIADRYRRYRAAVREAREAQFQAEVGELIQARLDAGYEGISAREVWQSLSSDLKSVRYTYHHLAKALAANDDST